MKRQRKKERNIFHEDRSDETSQTLNYPNYTYYQYDTFISFLKLIIVEKLRIRTEKSQNFYLLPPLLQNKKTRFQASREEFVQAC